jgi:predicted nucleotidyltransferase
LPFVNFWEISKSLAHLFGSIWQPEEEEAVDVDVAVDMVLSWIHLHHCW